MDREPFTLELEKDDFKEVAGAVRSDRQDLERVGVGAEVSPDDRVFDGVARIIRLHAVLEA